MWCNPDAEASCRARANLRGLTKGLSLCQLLGLEAGEKTGGSVLDEEGRVHLLEVWGDDGREVHHVQNLGLKVHARGDLDEHDALRDELEDGALGDHDDALALLASGGAVEGELAHV